jgi:aspartate dehydrogenase
MSNRTLRVGVIGLGAIGRALIHCLHEPGSAGTIEVVSVLDQAAARLTQLPPGLAGAVVTAEPDAFWSCSPQLVVECAGHAAVQAHGTRTLARGVDFLMISVGALADATLELQLRQAAEASTGRLLLPAGAVGGLDLLASARLAGLDRVRYVSRKPPRAWRGTPAERLLHLDSLAERVEFFTGNAREAARQYPQNANVAAAIALAGIGFEATEVVLTADPAATGNEHWFEVQGAFGRAEVRIAGKPLPTNPKTSWLAALSLARAVLNLTARVVI